MCLFMSSLSFSRRRSGIGDPFSSAHAEPGRLGHISVGRGAERAWVMDGEEDRPDRTLGSRHRSGTTYAFRHPLEAASLVGSL